MKESDICLHFNFGKALQRVNLVSKSKVLSDFKDEEIQRFKKILFEIGISKNNRGGLLK